MRQEAAVILLTREHCYAIHCLYSIDSELRRQSENGIRDWTLVHLF